MRWVEAVLFPATGFIEVVLHAGQLGGCPVIDELVLHAPLVLTEHTATAVQITLAPAAEGRRGFSVHARTGEAEQGTGLGVACQRDAERPGARGPGTRSVTGARDRGHRSRWFL